MMRTWMSCLLLLSVAQPALAQNGTRNGAIMGGVGGAVLGGIIGHQNDETPEGALIGGAVGAVAGGIIGNARDKQLARERYYQQQQWQAQQYQQYHYYNNYRSVPTQATVMQPVVTTNDVLSMTRSGVSENVIINHIFATGVQRRIDANEIIMLHQQGVSDNVISALQQAPIKSTTYAPGTAYPPVRSTTIVTQPGNTVIVQEPAGGPVAVPKYGPATSPSLNGQPNYLRSAPVSGYPIRRGF